MLRQLSRTLTNNASHRADPWPLQRTPEHLASTTTPNDDASLPLLPPKRVPGHPESALVHQSRKRGTLESDLLLSILARGQLARMSIEEMREYDRYVSIFLFYLGNFFFSSWTNRIGIFTTKKRAPPLDEFFPLGKGQSVRPERREGRQEDASIVTRVDISAFGSSFPKGHWQVRVDKHRSELPTSTRGTYTQVLGPCQINLATTRDPFVRPLSVGTRLFAPLLLRISSRVARKSYLIHCSFSPS